MLPDIKIITIIVMQPCTKHITIKCRDIDINALELGYNNRNCIIIIPIIRELSNKRLDFKHIIILYYVITTIT